MASEGLSLIIRSHEGPDARLQREDLGPMDEGYTIDHTVPSEPPRLCPPVCLFACLSACSSSAAATAAAHLESTQDLPQLTFVKLSTPPRWPAQYQVGRRGAPPLSASTYLLPPHPVTPPSSNPNRRPAHHCIQCAGLPPVPGSRGGGGPHAQQGRGRRARGARLERAELCAVGGGAAAAAGGRAVAPALHLRSQPR